MQDAVVKKLLAATWNKDLGIKIVLPAIEKAEVS
jgi:hypothetical protein